MESLLYYVVSKCGFWPRFYIVVIGIAFFLTLHLRSPISIWTFIPPFFLNFFPFSIISILFHFFFYSFSILFCMFLFYRSHILDFFPSFWKIWPNCDNCLKGYRCLIFKHVTIICWQANSEGIKYGR